MKFLCDVILSALPGQSNNSYFEIVIFHLDDYHWQQNFSNHTYKPLTTSKNISENFTLKLLFDAIFPSFSDQCDIPSFKMANFQLDDYSWWPNFSHHTKLKKPKTLTTSKGMSENFTLKLLSDVIFLSLSGQPNIHCFTMSNFRIDEYTWKPHFPNHIEFELKTSNWIQKTFGKSYFEAAVWRHFSSVGQQMQYSFFQENFHLKLQCDVIFPLLPDQSNIHRFTISNFQTDEYPCKPNFSNHVTFELKPSK